jgi:Winged helix-turn-helix DNA-binding
MSGGIRSRGTIPFTMVPNWRWEDDELDTYEFRIAGWIASHRDDYREAYVTRNEIARRTHISVGKVTLAVRRLTQLGILSVETLAGGRGHPRWVITIDFDVWAPAQRSPGDLKGHEVTSRGHDVTFEGGSHLSIQEEQGEEHSERRALVIVADDFDSFWGAYPRKVGKAAARKAWDGALKRASVDEVLMGASRVITLWQKYGYEQQFIPHASTWLNRDGWEDEVTPRAKPQGRAAENREFLDRLKRLADSDRTQDALERGNS